MVLSLVLFVRPVETGGGNERKRKRESGRERRGTRGGIWVFWLAFALVGLFGYVVGGLVVEKGWVIGLLGDRGSWGLRVGGHQMMRLEVRGCRLSSLFSLVARHLGSLEPLSWPLSAHFFGQILALIRRL